MIGKYAINSSTNLQVPILPFQIVVSQDLQGVSYSILDFNGSFFWDKKKHMIYYLCIRNQQQTRSINNI